MSGGFESLRVLLVDDNQHMRAIVTTVLAGVGVKQVRETRDGAEALEALRDWPADLAIVDFQMFPLDGVEFTRMVRNAPDSKNPYLPIIMMTGHSEKSRVFEARDAGVTEFVAKPLTAKAVLDRMQAVIYHPRPFVRTGNYFGPDRRRRDDPAFPGPWLRATDQDREAAAKAAAEKAGELQWDEA
jgi:CheY-like chemotaxis protein